MSTELVRCFIDLEGICCCVYEEVEDILGELAVSDLSLFDFWWRILFPFAVSGLATFFTYWVCDYLGGYLFDPEPVDAEEYMDGFERMAQVDAFVESLPTIVNPQDSTLAALQHKKSKSIMEDILELDSLRKKCRSSFDLKITPRQLGDFVSQRLAWLMALEASAPALALARSSPAAIVPAPTAVVIQDVTEIDMEAGDSEAGDSDGDLVHLEAEPVKSSFSDCDSDSDTGDFCVVPKMPKW